uniref:Putative secreted peptide n=1 Tax=Anopheles braziliensis TaxID=58242 RepID=A0A2M3ZTV4_9DIPT
MLKLLFLSISLIIRNSAKNSDAEIVCAGRNSIKEGIVRRIHNEKNHKQHRIELLGYDDGEKWTRRARYQQSKRI